MTAVVFRQWKDTGALVALFPELPSDAEGKFCDSYEAIGQHAGADYAGMIRATSPAKEFAPLAEELRRIGYAVRPVKRASRAMHKKRHTAARGVVVPESKSLEQLALTAFAETGEVSGLLILADWVDENQGEGGATYSAQLREVASDTFKADGVRFFYTHAGYSRHVSESAEFARFRNGYELREAEEWFEEREVVDESDPAIGEMQFRWEEDPDYDAGDYDAPHMPDTGYSCYLQSRTERGWYTENGLHAITFSDKNGPHEDDYSRVVQAEMARELKHAWGF